MLPKTTQTFNSSSFSTKRSGFLGNDPGDSIKTATDAGTISRSRSFSRKAEVGKRDSDFFKFKVEGSTSAFTAKLKNEEKDKNAIAMTILDRSGNAIRGTNGKFLFKNIQPGNTKQIKTSLSSGTYFIRLESAKGSKQDYDLTLAASSSGNIGTGGNLGDTQNLGRLQSGRTYRESGDVGGNSNVDSYQFSIDRTSRLLADLSNNGNDDIAFRLLNSSGEAVRSNSGDFLFANVRPNDDERLLAPTLGAGTYSFVITSNAGRNEDYSFTLDQSFVTPI